MPTCCVLKCSNNKKNSTVKFHRFPISHKQRTIWLEFCGRVPSGKIENSRVCSAHFTSEDYDPSSYQSQLLPTAIPSQNSPVGQVNLVLVDGGTNETNFREVEEDDVRIKIECEEENGIPIPDSQDWNEYDQQIFQPEVIIKEESTEEFNADFDEEPEVSEFVQLPMATPIMTTTDSLRGDHTCKYCQLQFKSRKTLGKHLRIHSDLGLGQLTCEHCDKTFRENRNLDRHLQWSGSGGGNEDAKECPKCELAFRWKCTLASHLRNNVHEKNFKCEYCSKSFYLNTDLNIHLVEHTKKRPYPCDICDKAFVKKATLANHKYLHTKKKEVKDKM